MTEKTKQQNSEDGMGEADQLSIPASPYDWPLLGPAAPETIALLVIDMQADGIVNGGWFTDMGFDLSLTQGIVPSLADLLSAARAVKNLNIAHFTESFAPDLSDLPDVKRERAIRFGTPHGARTELGRGMIHGEPGSKIVDELAPLPHEPLFNKTTYSAFGSNEFREWLDRLGIRSLIITGITSNVCVAGTLYAAVDGGYDCLTISDGVAGVNAAVTENLLGLVKYQGGLFGTAASAATAANSLRAYASALV